LIYLFFRGERGDVCDPCRRLSLEHLSLLYQPAKRQPLLTQHD
jgi:hypothetical protein